MHRRRQTYPAQLRNSVHRGSSLEFPGIRNDLPPLPQLADVVRRTIGETRQQATVVALGSSGLESAEPGALLAMVEELGVRQTLLAHDSITSYLGALGSTRRSDRRRNRCGDAGRRSSSRGGRLGLPVGDAGPASGSGEPPSTGDARLTAVAPDCADRDRQPRFADLRRPIVRCRTARGSAHRRLRQGGGRAGQTDRVCHEIDCSRNELVLGGLRSGEGG